MQQETELQTLLALYSALRQEISGFVNSLISLGSFVFLGVAAAFTLSFELQLAFLRILLPGIILILGVWGISHFYALYYEGTYVSVLERRINRLLGSQVLDWDSVWATPRAKPIVFLFLFILILSWFVILLGYALWDGRIALIGELAGLHKMAWLQDVLVTLYIVIHVSFAVCSMLLWVFWLPRDIRRHQTTWEEFYKLNRQAIKPPDREHLT